MGFKAIAPLYIWIQGFWIFVPGLTVPGHLCTRAYCTQASVYPGLTVSGHLCTRVYYTWASVYLGLQYPGICVWMWKLLIGWCFCWFQN